MFDKGVPSILVASSGGLLVIAWLWWPDLALGFGAENAPLGWLQSNWLIACATAAWLRATIRSDSDGEASGWRMLAVAFFLAGLDERFMFHEQAQDALVDLATGSLIDAASGAERIAQGLTAVYAFAGLVSARWFRSVADRHAWAWMRTAIVVGVAAILMDVATDAMGPQIIEEVLEFAAETLMLCALVKEVGTAGNR